MKNSFGVEKYFCVEECLFTEIKVCELNDADKETYFSRKFFEENTELVSGIEEVAVGQIWKYDNANLKTHDGDYVIIVDIEETGSQPVIVNIVADIEPIPLRYDETIIKRFFKRIS